MNGHPITPHTNPSSEAASEKKPTSSKTHTLFETFLDGIDEIESYK